MPPQQSIYPSSYAHNNGYPAGGPHHGNPYGYSHGTPQQSGYPPAAPVPSHEPHHHLWQYSSIADEMKQVRQIDRVTVVLPQGGTPGTHWALTTVSPNCDASVEPHPFYPQKVVSITNFRNINEAVRVEFSTTDPAVPPESRSGTISLYVQARDAYHHLYNLSSINGDPTHVRQYDRVTVTLPPTDYPWRITKAEHCRAELSSHPMFPRQMNILVTAFDAKRVTARIGVLNDDPALAPNVRDPSISLLVN